jgi:CubicO group peptidase (beta-lactamase class C family)
VGLSAVVKYLVDAPASWDKITIYPLLTHTSGISDDAAKYEPGTPDKLVFNDKPLTFEPGEQWAYTNMGYIVLGYLIERISGQTYEDFVQKNIFKPLGMNDSGMFSFVTVIPRRASGYWRAATGWKMEIVPMQGSASRQALSIPQLMTFSDGKRDCSAAEYCLLRPCEK